jgi:hypothetical protein
MVSIIQAISLTVFIASAEKISCYEAPMTYSLLGASFKCETQVTCSLGITEQPLIISHIFTGYNEISANIHCMIFLQLYIFWV